MSPVASLLAVMLLAAASQANPLFGAEERAAPLDDSKDVNYRLSENVEPISYKLHMEPRLAADTFDYKGTVEIKIKTKNPTKEIILHAKGLTIETKDISLVHQVANKPETIPAQKHELDDVREFLIITFEKDLAAKDYTLKISFSGKLTDSKKGFYRSSYLDWIGERKWLATTHFEPTGARFAFPCFDEPALKATFDISIKHSKQLHALSNTEGTPKAEGEYITTTFKTTPKMSTYLVAFVVSEYQSLESEDKKFKVWTKPDTLSSGKYALEVGQKILKELDTYTGINYYGMIPKMDQISIPDFAPSAMENWGLVTYAEKALLYTEGKTTTAQKQAITTVIAHEFAHQWFGNLVSPAWWKYVWLNEGFATYMQYIITNTVEDTWRLMDQFVVKGLQASAFEKDAQANSHAINHDVQSPVQIKSKFDAISYQKAGCVIRMMSHIVTEKEFQTGLKEYLKVNKDKAVTSDALLDQLEKVVPKKNLPTKADFKTVMKDWLEKPGYPVVHVKKNKEKGELVLTQERFGDGLNDDTKWWIPINYATEEKPEFEDTTPTEWMNPADKSLTIKESKLDKFVLVNKQQTGFYRVNYDEENWELLAKSLQSKEYGKILPVNRAQLLDDALSLAKVGKLNYATALQVSDYLGNEKDYIPWVPVFRHVNFLSNMLINTETQDVDTRFKEYFASRLKGIMDAVKLEVPEKDEHINKLARPEVLKWACWFGVKECTDHVNKVFADWVENTRKTLDVDLKEHILCAGVRNANAETLNKVVDEYKKAAMKSEDKRQLRSAVSCSGSEETLLKLLRANLRDDKTGEEFDAMMKSVLANSRVAVKLGLEIVNDNYTAIQQFDKDGSKMKAYLNQIGSRVTNVQEYVKLGVTVAKMKIPADVSADAFQSAGKNLYWINSYSAPITTWMDSKRPKEENSAHSMSVSAAAIIISLAVARLF